MSYLSYNEAKIIKKEMISDHFESDLGQWFNYGTIDIAQGGSLIAQRHTDLRSFYPAITKPIILADLSSKTMTQLNDLYMDRPGYSSINDPIIVKQGETWTGGSNTIDNTSTWKRLKFNCNNSSQTTVYSKTDPIDINQYANDGYITFSLPNYPSLSASNSSISITTDTTASGFDVNQTNTFTFAQANVSGSGVILTTLNNNAELKIQTNKLTNVFNTNNVNKGFITGIKFVIQLSPQTTPYFYCAGIKCISSNWQYAPIDINTLENKVVKTVPPTGSIVVAALQSNLSNSGTSIYVGSANVGNFPTSGTVLINNAEYINYTGKNSSALTGCTRGVFGSTAIAHASGVNVELFNFDYPVNSIGSKLPTKWPVLYRTFHPAGQQSNDLNILNGGVYGVINMGNVLGEIATPTDPNILSFYFRHTIRPPQQNELNNKQQQFLNQLNSFDDVVSGTVEVTQSMLSKIPGNKAALTLGSNVYPTSSETYQVNPNSLISDGIVQEGLNGKLQSDLENINGGKIAYLGTHLKWYKDGSDLVFKMTISDELATLFEFPINLSLNNLKNKTIVFKAEVIDQTVQCKLFKFENNRLILLATTNKIQSNFIYRKKGSFGWYADLKDGQTQIQSIRANKIVYGEYKTSIINSITPVKGAQIFSNQTAEKELVTDVGSNNWSLNTNAFSSTIDNTNYDKPVSIYTISDSNNSIWQGIETNSFDIQNFEDIYIKFDIIYSGDNRIKAYLYDKDNYNLFQLTVGKLNNNQWQSMKIIASNDQILPGRYSLIILEDGYNNNTPWSVKNISIKQREVSWEARGFVDSGWGIDDRDWVADYFVNLIPNNNFSNQTNVNDGVLFAKQDTELQVRAHALNPYVEIYNFDVKPKYATLGNMIWTS